MDKLVDYIKVYDEIFTPEDTDLLQELYEDDFGVWEAATTVGKTHDYRVCDTMGLAPGTIHDDLVYKKVSEVFNRLNEEYSFLNLSNDDGYRLLRYSSGDVTGKYDIHIDHGKVNNRIITLILFINDNYTGGDLVFFTDSSHTIQPKSGRVVAFPSSFQYPHAVTPVLSGERRTMITWGT